MGLSGCGRGGLNEIGLRGVDQAWNKCDTMTIAFIEQ